MEQDSVRLDVGTDTATYDDKRIGSTDCDNSMSNARSCDDVQTNYIFPSFFVFLAWGPFILPYKRLPLTLITDVDKKKRSGSRAEQRR